MRNPADDFAFLSAAPVPVAIGGRSYLVAKLSPRGMGRLQAALNAIVPDPRDAASRWMEGKPDAVQLAIWRDACEAAKSWPVRIGSEEGTQALLTSPEGMTTLVEVLLGPANEGFTRERAAALADALTAADVAALFRAAGPGDPHAPKAAAGEPGPGAS